MADRIFYISSFGFLSGVLLRSFAAVNLYFAILTGAAALCLFLFFSLVLKNKWGIITSIFVLAFSFGIFRFSMVDVPDPQAFESHVGQTVSFTGEIIDQPSAGENNQKLTVEIQAGNDRREILVSARLDADYKYGDEIRFSGTLKKPENFMTDQGKEFDYINYLRKDGILYVMSYPKVDIVSSGNGNSVRSALFFAKEKFLEKLNFAIQSPENLLMDGLILGEKSNFDQSMRQSFVDTGTIHIVALSGYNVTIVAVWIMKLVKAVGYLPKNFGIGAGIFSIIFFIIMTGASSTAIRAGIMAILALVARATGRNYDVGRALILAAVGMVLLNPFILVYDVSFQLSMLATIAVIFLAPKIEKYFLWMPEHFQLRDIASVTFAAYIFVFPFILYEMGNLSLVALPANMFILPFIPFTMGLGFLTGLVGLLWYVPTVPLGFISYLFLHYELGVIAFFSHLPFAAFSFPNFPLVLTIVIYVYFTYRLFGRSIKTSLDFDTRL